MDYAHFVKQTERLYLDQLSRSQGHKPAASAIPQLGPAPIGTGPNGQPIVLIVAPHPDDECLMGSYAFRMKLEWKARVIVMPFSLGSNVARREERKRELAAACKVLDFELLMDAADVTEAVARIAPDFVFSPHAEDGHPTHVRAYEATHLALNAYLDRHPAKVFHWLQTEFWHAIKTPNLLIPLTADQVTMIGLALVQHQGEVARNPYHLRLPAWYMDQVRRGSELVGGLGGVGHADWVFGQLYLRVEYSRA